MTHLLGNEMLKGYLVRRPSLELAGGMDKEAIKGVKTHLIRAPPRQSMCQEARHSRSRLQNPALSQKYVL